jgi:hypothetical protein
MMYVLNNRLLNNFLLLITIINIHKWLRNVCGVIAVHKSTVSCWASQLADSENGQVEFSNLCHSGQDAEGVTLVDIL